MNPTELASKLRTSAFLLEDLDPQLANVLWTLGERISAETVKIIETLDVNSDDMPESAETYL